MTEVKILSEEEIAEDLKNLPGWTYKEDKIFKQFEFKDFMDSLGFINDLASYFEKMDHHPDTHIFYSKVLFELQRFDVGGKVTDKDMRVAQEIEKRYKSR
jgi:4a-hydroxytetrahydrobiopterin dehydratase